MTETNKALAPEDLESKRRRLLQYLLEEEEGAEPDLKEQQRIGVRDRSVTLPLSFAQQRLWVLSHLVDDDSAYNIATALRLTGRLHITALNGAFNELVRRHEVLRTTFAALDDQPVQVVSEPSQLDIPIIDLRELSFEEREAAIGNLTGEDALRPFDLEEGPLLRARLVLMSGGGQVLMFGMHHIVSDGWSVGVLKREVASLYDAFAGGMPSPLE
ncbi:MAG: condensation domain-containing protein, partial [Blastocatellia bacterium]